VKTIIVQWVPEASPYRKAMRVIASDHPRYTVGSRFDYGFFSIVTDDGYMVVSIPMPPSEELGSGRNSQPTAKVSRKPKLPKR
jgi:hypothetical protein